MHFVYGWAALRGDAKPRDVTVRIDNYTFKKKAAQFRADLLELGINTGHHGFELQVPWRFLDGARHQVQLIDDETGIVLAKRVVGWPGSVPPLSVDGMLALSMTQPVLASPFSATVKQYFGVLESVANDLEARALALKERPLVSIIMPTYNRAHFVERAIRTVIEQSYTNFELLVVESDSAENSAARVAAFQDRRIHFLAGGEIGGVAAARNVGLAEARGEIIAYLHSDDTWDPRYLAANVGAFSKLPQAGAIYSGSYVHFNQDPAPNLFLYGHFHRALLENRNYIRISAFTHRAGIKVPGGVFDENLPGDDDIDFILRLSEAHSLYSMPVALSHYLISDTEPSLPKPDTDLAPWHMVRERVAMRNEARLAAALCEAPKPQKNVTAIIPNWNALPDLQRCLQSLYDQGWGNMLEIVVVDNASEAPVRDFLRGEAAAGRLRLIQNEVNLGFTFAVNQGIYASDAKSDLLLLNSDAVLRGPALLTLQEAALTLPKAGILAPRQILPAGTPRIGTYVPFADSQYEVDATISALHRNVAPLPLFQTCGPIELTFATFFAVYIRRAVVESVGLLDAEHGRHYRSDGIYCEKMRLFTDYKIYYVPDAHFEHRVQVATNELRYSPEKQAEFAYMFQQNRWEPELAERYGFRRKAWDLK